MVNRHLSVLGLWVRNRLGRVLALLGLMAALETALFGVRLYLLPESDMELVLKGVPLLSALALVALYQLLTLSGDQRKAAGYTLGRLGISEGAATLWKGLFGTVCFLLLWAVQTCVCLGLCAWYAAAVGPAHSSTQTVLLAFYRTDYLHSLLPLAERSGYVRNLLLAAGLGLETALCSFRMRRGRRGLLGLGMALAVTQLFTRRLGFVTGGIWHGLAVLGIAGLDCLLVLTSGEEEWER